MLNDTGNQLLHVHGKLVPQINKQNWQMFLRISRGGAPIAKKQDWTKQQKLDFKIAFSVRYL